MGNASDFLSSLGRSAEAIHTFVLIDDCKRGPKPIHLRGTWDQCRDQIYQAQAQKWGAYVVAQGMAGPSRSTDISSAQALFIDADGACLPSPVPPSAVVSTSPGRQHLWWFLQPDEPLEAVSPALRRLISYFDSDPVCHDLARVLRLPDTVNWKRTDPYIVQCTELHPDRRYTIAEVLSGLETPKPEHVRDFARSHLHRLAAQIRAAKEGDRNAAVHRCAWQVKDWVGLGHLDQEEAVGVLLEAASAIVSPDFGWAEVQASIVSAFRSVAQSDTVRALASTTTAVTAEAPTALQSAQPMDIAVRMLRAHGLDEGVIRSNGAQIYRYREGLWEVWPTDEIKGWIQSLHGAACVTKGKLGSVNLTPALRDQIIDLSLYHAAADGRGLLSRGQEAGVLLHGVWLHLS